MKQITKLILILILTSCGNSNKDKTATKVDYIKTLIKKVGFQELPYSHDLMKDKEEYKYNVDRNSMDTLFFDDLNGHIIGVLPDTSKYYCFLYFGVGDVLYPCLTTIDKKGNKIDNKSICIGQCAGVMIDYDTCIDRVTIEKDLTINMFYKLHGFVEREDNITKVDTICNQMIWTGRITKNGKIEVKETELESCR